MEFAIFVVAGAIVLSGAIGVIASRNPVHSALFLVQTLFGIAVLFIAQDAHFLAAVQIIVYAGAIVILFLFVIMLLGVDKAEDLGIEPIAGQRPIAAIIGAASLGALVTVVAIATDTLTGARGATAELVDQRTKSNVAQVGEQLFTRYAYPFEITAILLTIAVVGAVVLSRRVSGDLQPIPEQLPIGAGDDHDDPADVDHEVHG